jgi:trimethyllysine dioxygenase
VDIDVIDSGLVIGDASSSTTLPWAWVRDHCDDPMSVDPDTRQRRGDTFGNETPGRPEVTFSSDRLGLRWPNGADLSISHSCLAAATTYRRCDPATIADGLGLGDDVTLWHNGADVDTATFDAAEICNDVATRRAFVDAIWRWGVVCIDGCEPGEATVERLAQSIGYVRRTVFGDVWELAAEVTAHQDSAYTKVHLGPHTDGTYLHDAPGLQLFVCQDRDGTGGDSIIVDGFAAASRIADRRALELLSGIDVPGHYVEPGVDLRAERPPLRFDSTGRLVQVSLNNYDRRPFFAGEHDAAFRTAYAEFSHDVDDARRWHHIAWEPGRAMIIDNWRVLHGRTSFTGSRRFLGAYLNHEDLESTRRVLAS